METSDRSVQLSHRSGNRAGGEPPARFPAIDYHSGRKLNKALIERLARCEYIAEARNIFITGATGSGKTYLACALGMEAYKRYYSVKYVVYRIFYWNYRPLGKKKNLPLS